MFYDGRRPVHSDRRIDHPAMKMVVAWQKDPMGVWLATGTREE